MKLNNALITGNLPTTATGIVNRVGVDYLNVTKTDKLTGDKLFLRSLLLPDYIVDDVIDYCLEKKPSLIVCAGDDLYEAGKIEASCHLSPVMLLHKLGLLNKKCSVVGGICLDHDDVDVMAQTGAKLIVCPSYSCGKGKGLPLLTYAEGKIDVSIGTYDNSFNKRGDVMQEARVLLLGTNCEMRKENSLSPEFLARMCGADDVDEFIRDLL